jgi:hypothetical protein
MYALNHRRIEMPVVRGFMLPHPADLSRGVGSDHENRWQEVLVVGDHEQTFMITVTGVVDPVERKHVVDHFLALVLVGSPEDRGRSVCE